MTKDPYKGGKSADDLPPEIRQNLIKLSSNENPLGPSPAAVARIRAMVETVDTYPAKTLDDLLRETIVAQVEPRLTAEHVIAGNGGVEVLELVGRTYLADPEAECVLPRPTFPYLERYCQSQSRKMVRVDLDPDQFTYDPAVLLAAVTDKTRIVYLSNPNNPTGTYLSASDLEVLIDQLPDDVLVIHDEAYYQFVDAPDFPQAVDHVLAGKNVLVLHSFSKVFGLAGLRLGYAIAPPAVIAKLTHLYRPFHLNKLTLAAGVAALGDREHIQRTVANNAIGRAWLTEQLQALGCRVWPSQGNFVMFRYGNLTGQSLTDQLLEQAVMVRPAFGLTQHVRVSVGTPEQNERFIEALKQIL